MPVKKRATAAARPAPGAAAAPSGGEAGEEEEELSDSDAPVDGYDSELYGDEADRARLLGMGELERENVLYERSQQRQEALEARRLKREAKSRRLGLRGVVTRGAAPGALTGKSAKAAALEQIREARQRGQTGADRAKAAAARATQALELAGEEDGGDYSEEEEGRRRGRGRGRGRRRGASVSGSDGELGSDEDEDDVQLAGFQDILTCCVTRVQLEKWTDKPFFEAVLTGCFVRVGTGVGGDGVAVYRMARVVGVAVGTHPVTGQELRPYEFGHPPGRRSPQWLLLQHGDQQKAFKMSLVSNAAPQEREFAGWARGEMDAGRKPLRLSDVRARRKAILAADAYRWASADVARVLAAKKAAQGGPRNVALEKERLAARLEVAVQEGDEHTALDCRASLDELERDTANLPRGAAAMTSINKRNAQVNIQLIDESYSARETAAKAAAGATGANDVDPFSRRPTRVTNYWQTKSKEQQDSEAAAAAAAPPALLPPPEEEAAAAEPTEAPDPRLLASAWPPEHPQAAAHRAAYTPLNLSRLAGPKVIPVLAGWTGGLGAAEAAIRSGVTLMTITDYRKRLQEAADARAAQQQQLPPPPQAYYQNAPLPPPPPPPPMQPPQQWY